LVDFRLRGWSVFKALEKKIIEHALREYPKEACGLLYVKGLVEIDYAPCRNATESKSTDSFYIHPDDYLEVESRGRVLALVHSHPDASPEPSETDLAVCQVAGLDCVIVGFPDGKDGVPQFFKHGVIRKELAFEKRPFLHGVIDCYSLIRDWYWKEHEVDLPDVYRPDEWWTLGLNLYVEGYQKAGFKLIMKYPSGRDFVDLQRGDVLLMNVAADVTNHAAIYIPDNKILHHPYGALSKEEIFGIYYRHRTTHWLRFESVPDAA
jgi:proteasome lid subunit RPN8/RPN11